MSAESTFPYLGSKISLISCAQHRYEGTLVDINVNEHTVTLAKACSFGTEDRVVGPNHIPPSNEIFECIIFKGKQIKDITVCELVGPDDPAIVAINPFLGAQQQANFHNSGMNYPRRPQMMHPYNQRVPPSQMKNQVDPSNYMSGIQQPMMPSARGGNYGMNYHYYYPRGGHGENRNGGRGHHRVVGELEPQPNSQLKNLMEKAFDFEQANANLDPANLNACAAAPSSTVATADKEADKADAEHPVPGSDETVKVKPVYDQKNSFFDNISCETADRRNGSSGRMDPSKQRLLDLETFGSTGRHARTRRTGMRMGYRGGMNDGYHYRYNMYGNYNQHQNPMDMMSGYPSAQAAAAVADYQGGGRARF